MYDLTLDKTQAVLDAYADYLDPTFRASATRHDRFLAAPVPDAPDEVQVIWEPALDLAELISAGQAPVEQIHDLLAAGPRLIRLPTGTVWNNGACIIEPSDLPALATK
ncbi:hypothetical protein CKO28_00180 [Rhodovibrio sodomensis]|uniref:Uncharacterized protein n=1 Tax=Rhodovibrio sodomensis TaxID=1088 RepID=A0ABS1D986_9PROT|nr:hypothetical protein [Rhodovibrio sodomensis]MBK1666456.1 hypothetical protein [Rhodovibrio sodomensis]